VAQRARERNLSSRAEVQKRPIGARILMADTTASAILRRDPRMVVTSMTSR